MFNPRKLMSPYYADLSNSFKGDLSKEKRVDGHLVTLMNWADPFRPDDSVPEHIKHATIESLNSTAAHYTWPMGDMTLRNEVAKRVRRVNGLDVDALKHVTISSGSDTSFFFVMRPFLEPGDEVLTPDPSYSHNYVIPRLCGAKVVPVPTRPDDGYELHVGEFDKLMSKKTKMVVITNPNNPTTTVYGRKGLEDLAKFVIANDLILVVDQCFEDTAFDGYEMVDIMAMPGMFERTIMVNSVSKGMGLCGYRIRICCCMR